MNLKELQRSLWAEYEEKRNIEALRQRQAQDLIYQNHPYLKSLEEDYGKMKLEIVKAVLKNPEMGQEADLKLAELEEDFTITKDSMLKELGFESDPRLPQYECQLCKDTGETDQGLCLCYKQKLASRIFQQEYERGKGQASLSKMSFSIYSTKKEKEGLSQRDNILGIVEDLNKFVQDFDSNLEGTNIIFSGQVSQGKTYLSAALAMELIEKGRLVIYQTVPSLLELLRELAWNYNENSVELKKMIYDCDMLILDDLGKETINDYSRRQLFHILNMRYTARKSTLISSNLELLDIEKIYGDAFFTRLMERCIVPNFFGPDLRLGG